MLISGLEIPLHSCGNRFLSSRHCSCHRERGGEGNRCSSISGTVVLPCHQSKSSSSTAKLRPCVKIRFICSTTHRGSLVATRSFQRRDARKHKALGDDLPNEVYSSERVLKDLEQEVPGSVPIPLENSGKGEIIDYLVTNVESMIRADRKVTALKELQGHIRRYGFQSKELESVIFDDVPEALNGPLPENPGFRTVRSFHEI